MEIVKKKILIVAGEASGDMHAANLVLAIKNINPQIEFFGLGGKKMQQAGVDLLFNLADLAVVGFIEILRNFRKIKQAFSLILKKADEINPDAAILVDYPGFNLRLAKELKKRNIKVIYYISPQIWAWGLKRVNLIKKVVDKMIVLFKFEEELYQKFGVDAFFAGHPFLETVTAQLSRQDFLKNYALPPGEKQIIGLMPGSRKIEVLTLLPLMIKTAQLLNQEFRNTFFLVIKSQNVPQDLFDKFLSGSGLPYKIIENQSYDCINACDFVLVASGSATLEVAILQKPMVVIYKVSILTWVFLKFMLKIPYVGLVNVVVGRKIVPECLQFKATPKNIFAEIKNILISPEKMNQLKNDLQQVKESLGATGAAKRAATLITNMIR